MVDIEWSSNTDWTNAQSSENIDINSGTFELADAIPNSIVSRENDDDSFSSATQQGLEVELKSDWPSIGARISANTSGATRAYLRQPDGTLIQDVDVSGLSAGNAFTFDSVDLQSGNRYHITLDAEGSNFTKGYNGNAANYPYQTADIDITARVSNSDGDSNQNIAWVINDIGNVGF